LNGNRGAFLPQIEAVTPEFLELLFLVMAQRPTEAEAIA
jgi:hypothetical protein